VQLRIALKNELPEEFELTDGQQSKESVLSSPETDSTAQEGVPSTDKVSSPGKEQHERAITAEGTAHG
jgi:hypothetical protein